MWFYRPITGKYLNEDVFYILGYYVPDILPTLVQIFIIQRTKRREVQNRAFIDDLYKAADEDQEESSYIEHQSKRSKTPLLGEVSAVTSVNSSSKV